jgi:hypothetical protein
VTAVRARRFHPSIALGRPTGPDTNPDIVRAQDGSIQVAWVEKAGTNGGSLWVQRWQQTSPDPPALVIESTSS